MLIFIIDFYRSNAYNYFHALNGAHASNEASLTNRTINSWLPQGLRSQPARLHAGRSKRHGILIIEEVCTKWIVRISLSGAGNGRERKKERANIPHPPKPARSLHCRELSGGLADAKASLSAATGFLKMFFFSLILMEDVM